MTADRLGANDLCAIATDRYHGIALWRQLFTILIFVVASVVVVFLVLCVVFATNEEWVATTATGLGSLVTGAPLRWVLRRRSEAVKEEEKAFREAKATCGGARDLEEIASNLKLSK